MTWQEIKVVAIAALVSQAITFVIDHFKSLRKTRLETTVIKHSLARQVSREMSLFEARIIDYRITMQEMLSGLELIGDYPSEIDLGKAGSTAATVMSAYIDVRNQLVVRLSQGYGDQQTNDLARTYFRLGEETLAVLLPQQEDSNQTSDYSHHTHV